MKHANIAVRFLLELLALAALGYWGGTVKFGITVRVTLATALPLVSALFWGAFISPRARVTLPPAVRLLLSLVVFACATGALIDRNQLTLAVLFMTVAVINTMLLLVWSPHSTAFRQGC